MNFLGMGPMEMILIFLVAFLLLGHERMIETAKLLATQINDKTIRVSQSFGINKYGDNQYGKQILLNHIKNINPEKFEEEILIEIKADFKDDLLGIHHMNGNESFTVFDCCAYD